MAWVAAVLALALQDPPVIYETQDGNAAEVYRATSDLFKNIPEAVFDFSSTGKGDLKEVRAGLAPFEPALEKWEKAARLRRCEWDYPERKSLTEKPAHVPALIRGGRLLKARAHLRLQEGRTDAALEDVFVLYRVGSHSMEDGPILSHLVGLVLIFFAHDIVQLELAPREHSSDQLRRLAAHAEATLARLPTVRRCLEHDKTLWLGVLDRVIEDFPGLVAEVGGKESDPDDPMRAVWKDIEELLKVDSEASKKFLAGRLEKHWEDVLHDAELPLHAKAHRLDTEAQKGKTVRALAEFKVLGDRVKALEGAAGALLGLATPAVHRLKARHAEGKLSLQEQVLWCRLALHRRQKGAYPASLEEAGLKVEDPYDGKPLKYQRFEGAFVLTSAGPKGDWKERITVLAGKCRFDVEAYERERGKEASGELTYTLWANPK